MQETLIWFRDLEDSLEGSMATHSSILAWRILMDRGAWWAAVHESQRIGHDWVTRRAHIHTHTYIYIYLFHIIFHCGLSRILNIVPCMCVNFQCNRWWLALGLLLASHLSPSLSTTTTSCFVLSSWHFSLSLLWDMPSTSLENDSACPYRIFVSTTAHGGFSSSECCLFFFFFFRWLIYFWLC